MPTTPPPTDRPSTDKPPGARLLSLDQFRGYTIAAMVVVNFIGGFPGTPLVFTHRNTFFSFSDTVMPQFFFAVGFAFRLTFGRRTKTEGLAAAYVHVARRLLGLALVGMVLKVATRPAANWAGLVALGPGDVVFDALVQTWFGPLLQIAVTSLWVLPVIRARAGVRVAYMLLSFALQVILSHWFYFDWVQQTADGGPLGFLAWTMPTIVGTLACDAIVDAGGKLRLSRMIACSVLMMVTGYLLSCGTTLYDVPPSAVEGEVAAMPADPVLPGAQRWTTPGLRLAEAPFVPAPSVEKRQLNYWMMSQRAATLSYHLFGAGFSLAVYVLCYVVCDLGGLQLGLFRTFGTNALVAYVIHELVGRAVEPFLPRDAPTWYIAVMFTIYFGITYLFVRSLEKNKIFLKL